MAFSSHPKVLATLMGLVESPSHNTEILKRPFFNNSRNIFVGIKM